MISGEDEFRSYERYIRDNPRNWARDRWGAVTTHVPGEESRLNFPKHAFVASQGFPASALVSRCIESLKSGSSVQNVKEAVLFSTFTSAQERAVLHRVMTKKGGIIHVCPQGIPPEDELTAEQKLALQKKRILFISSQPSGSRLNKKESTGCNEYVLQQAREVWVGNISPNGMLSTMIDALIQEKSGRSP